MIAEKNGITVDTRTAAPARKMIKCPQKTGINLNLQEARQRDRRTLLIGILAIAAAMLGADVQTIVDIDENCLKTAHENAEKNHVEIGRGLCGDALRDPKLVEDIGGGYDVIVANIVADVIIGMSPMFADKLVKGGTLICSGILNERAEEVRAALEKSGFTILSHAKSDDWSAFAAKK